MEITIKKASVTKKSSNIIEACDDFSDDIKRILFIIENINTVWEGADALKYINVMKDKYIPGLNELSDVIDEYGNYLKNIPEAYSLLDESFSTKNIDV